MGEELLSPLIISLKVSFTATLVATPFSILIGWWLSRLKKTTIGDFVEVLIMLPMMVSPVIIGYFFLSLLKPSSFLGEILNGLDVRFVFDWKGEALAVALIGLPLYAQAININFAMIDKKLDWISRSLGNGFFLTFLKVHLPLCKKGIITGAVLCFVRGMGEFGATSVIGGGIIGETETLPIAIYRQLNSPGAEDQAFMLISISVSMTVFILAVLKLTEKKYFNREKPTKFSSRRRRQNGHEHCLRLIEKRIPQRENHNSRKF